MREVVEHLHLYPDGNAFYSNRSSPKNWGVKPANLILGNGSNEIIEFVGHAYMAPGTDVVVSQYCFAVYPLVTKLFGANLVTVPAKNMATICRRCSRPSRRRPASCSSPTRTIRRARWFRVAELLLFVKEVPPEVLLVMDEAYIEFPG